MTLWPNLSHADQTEAEFHRIFSAHGSKLTTTEGQHYFDLRVESAAAILGQNNPAAPAVAQILAAQLSQLEYSTLFRASNAPAQGLANQLLGLFAGQFSHVFLSSTPSEAIETALKMARQYHVLAGEAQRSVVVSIQGALYGQLMGGLSASSCAVFQAVGLPNNPNFVSFSLDPKDPVHALRKRLAHIGHERISAVILQPILPWLGCQVLTPDILSSLQKETSESGGLLIVDETLSGFGRVAFPAVSNSLTADMLCLGAAMANGAMPIAATLASDRVYQRFVDGNPELCFEHGCTNAGHPVACAMASASLDMLQKAADQPDLTERISELAAGLSVFALQYSASLQGSGLIWGLSFAGSATITGTDAARWLAEELSLRGILLSCLENCLCLCPPATISSQDIKFLIEALNDAAASILCPSAEE